MLIYKKITITCLLIFLCFYLNGQYLNDLLFENTGENAVLSVIYEDTSFVVAGIFGQHNTLSPHHIQPLGRTRV